MEENQKQNFGRGDFLKRYYILHCFDPANVGSFLLVSMLGLIVVLALVLLIAKFQIQRQLKEETEEKAKKVRRKKHQRQMKRSVYREKSLPI